MTLSEHCKEPYRSRGRPRKPKDKHIQSIEHSNGYPFSCEECGSTLIWASVGRDSSYVELVCPCCGLVHCDNLVGGADRRL